MNIFVLDLCPVIAARHLCDKHVPKMAVETAQMLASAVRRHGATDADMPLTQAGTPYRGGYHHHPCTVWAGDTCANYQWLARHGREICHQYEQRFGKVHACEGPIIHLADMEGWMPAIGTKTPHAQAMPDQYRDTSPVRAYRRYYLAEKAGFASWDRCIDGPPQWWIDRSAA